MNEHLFLKGQRVIMALDSGEVIDAIGDAITVKPDDGTYQIFPSVALTDDSSTG